MREESPRPITQVEGRGPAGSSKKAEFDRSYLYADGISQGRQELDRRFSRAVGQSALFVNDHWLFFFNALNAVVLVGAIAVPFLKYAGLNDLANPLFDAYKIICVQNPDHSYFILGYQMAMDQRMMAIAAAGVLAGLLFIPLRQRIKPLDWRLYLLLILPMAVDGFTQLFGWRHSNWELRTLTGGIFGLATIWLAYPYLQAAAVQTSAEWRGLEQ